MTDFGKRLQKLELKRASRQGSGLSSERRKLLTDRAVLNGDQEALLEMSHHRPAQSLGTVEQHAAAMAAGTKADS